MTVLAWLIPIVGILLIVALVVAIFLAVRQAPTASAGSPAEGPGGVPPTGQRSKRSALEILDERYARGEIDREEYLQRKTDLS